MILTDAHVVVLLVYATILVTYILPRWYKAMKVNYR